MLFYWIIIATILVLSVVGMLTLRWYYRKSLVNEMNRSERNERLKTVFMANVSHALRTPLQAIMNDSEQIIRLGDTPITSAALSEVMTRINEHGKQLMFFISQLIELSNFESSLVGSSMYEVNLAELMASYRREGQRDADPKVTVGTRSKLSPHCKATLDTNLMYQLMMHLLHHAASHTHEGTITIAYEAEGKGLRVRVIDTGDGQSQSLQANYSELLQHGDALSFFNQTSGFDLSICKSIVEAMKGEINLTTEPDMGTTVDVWFPCRLRHKHKEIL